MQRWASAACSALVLHFRPAPPQLARNDPANSFRFVCTGSPTAPLPTGQRLDADARCPGPVVLCGLSLCLDPADGAYYISLPPPFRERPFPHPCLGDPDLDLEEDGGKRHQQQQQQQARGAGRSSSSVAQALPEAVLSRIFALVGYTHALGLAGNRAALEPLSTRNAALMACRRWNRVGSQRWFNRWCSLTAWHHVRAVLSQEGTCKVLWDAVAAIAALRERGVDVAGPVLDPKVRELVGGPPTCVVAAMALRC
jgi:hypothetical protein